MKLPPFQIALLVAALMVILTGLSYGDRLVAERHRAPFRLVMVALALVTFFFGIQQVLTDHAWAVDAAKAVIAGIAAACVFYEAHRAAIKRPVAEKWKKFIAITLGVAGILAYFNGLRFGYHKYYHRWDQYHYYMGAKYFPELGYDGLYKCAVVAQDDLGVHRYVNEDTGRTLTIDMSKEVRHPDKKIRNLGGDNLLKPVKDILEKPEECKGLFSPERWTAFKNDVAFFRTSSDKGYWEDMQKDHGFNPPPVWTVAGKLLSDAHPAATWYLQFLASLDIFYLLGMFAAIYWAFGWRVFAVAAVFWGCQSSAPFYWTGGAFLRQDWLFYLVMAACFVRKKYFALGAASLVYAGLLRIFPGLVVVGWLAVVFWQLVRHRTLTRPQWRMLAGGTAAAAILVGASLYVCGKDSKPYQKRPDTVGMLAGGWDAYVEFYRHTLEVHDHTPLTNHMGLRVLIAQKSPIEIPAIGLGVGKESGRMKYTKDGSLTDPFKIWKDMREDRYKRLKPVAYGIILLTLFFFGYVIRRVKNMWVAMSLAQVFVIILSQLTCYYYSFMILGAMLTRVKPLRMHIELALFGLAIVTQAAWRFYWNDDKYWMLTFWSLVVCYGYLVLFAPSKLREQILERIGRKPAGGQAPSTSTSPGT